MIVCRSARGVKVVFSEGTSDTTKEVETTSDGLGRFRRFSYLFSWDISAWSEVRTVEGEQGTRESELGSNG